MPKSSLAGRGGRGFLRLDRSGPRDVIMVDAVPSVSVVPFDTEVNVVETDPKLPAYGLPDAEVMAMPRSVEITGKFK